MQKLFRTLMLTLLTAASSSLSAAPMGYSINSDSGSSDSDSLYLIDLETGVEIQRIGTVQSLATPRLDVEGLAFAPNGTLYGIDDDQLTLFPIDIVTAAVDTGNEVSVTGLPAGGSNDFGMTFACDGTLYVSSVTERALYQMALDGTATKIGNLGVNISALAAYGNPARLYGLGNGTASGGFAAAPDLYEIDISTGVATKIGPLGPGVEQYAEGGLAFDGDGQLWAITDRRAQLQPSQVMRINSSTGTASDFRNTTEQGFESLAISVPRGCEPQGSGQHAAFTVQKRFEDNNNLTPVELSIKCDTGLPLEQSLMVLPNEGAFGRFEVEFIVESFTDGALDCEVWEETPPGYSPEYDCRTGSSCSTNTGSGPCSFQNVGIGQENICLIQNRVDPVEISVTKEWLYNREELVVDDSATTELFCAGVFAGDGVTVNTGLMYWSWLIGGSQASHKATVYPDFAGTTHCWTVEKLQTSAVESTSTCSPPVTIGLGDVERSCIVTNTVFFEGIPTLSQYGLALISVLMLLTGLIAARRTG